MADVVENDSVVDEFAQKFADVVEKPSPADDHTFADVVLNALPVFWERKYEADVVLNDFPTDV